MKKVVILVLSILIYQIGFTQKLVEPDLIGEWEFIELQDVNGSKQTEIPLGRFGQNRGVEKVNRDSYIFKNDGTYESYNPLNISTGTWYLDKATNEINLELRIDPNSPYLKYGKMVNNVKKRKDGFYYQSPVKKKILVYSSNAMTIADREEYVLIYKRK
jgi:hypothetical protein